MAFVPGATLTHNNFPILAPTLTSAQLATALLLTPIAPNPPYDGSVNIGPIGPALFNILFKETVNESASCPNGQGGTYGSPNCADIFVLLNPADLDVDLGFLGGDSWFYTAHLTRIPRNPDACPVRSSRRSLLAVRASSPRKMA